MNDFKIENGVLLEYSGKDENVIIPNEVSKISCCAFEELDFIQSVSIPSSVTEIGFNAFCRCTALKSVTIGKSVKSVGMEAFCGCHALKSVTMFTDTRIYDDAFCDFNGEINFL